MPRAGSVVMHARGFKRTCCVTARRGGKCARITPQPAARNRRVRPCPGSLGVARESCFSYLQTRALSLPRGNPSYSSLLSLCNISAGLKTQLLSRLDPGPFELHG